MKTFVFAYLGGLLGSVPAYWMFSDVGASPFRNLDPLMAAHTGSLLAIVEYFALLWLVPAIWAQPLALSYPGTQEVFNTCIAAA